ncbi:uncharacterized protein DS421_11g337730 [Arachis hypogaea]|nr:uncharacterized protein DS421_11g337730 [Arachis hypogaea]
MDNFGTVLLEGKTITLNLNRSPGYDPKCLNLVGKVITDKEIKFKVCKNTLLALWGNPTGVGRNKILISFKDRSKGKEILDNGPWNIRGNLLNLQHWSQRESIFEVRHDVMEFWIQLHGFPEDHMRDETTMVVGNMVGLVSEVEDPLVDGVLMRNYLRFIAAINITKPLQTGFWLARDNLPETWISFKYERLQDAYCLNYGIIGHDKRSCINPTAMASWDPSKPRYSKGMGVRHVRALSSKNSGKREEFAEHAYEEEDIPAHGVQTQPTEDRETQEKED